MTTTSCVFEKLQKLIHEGNQSQFLETLLTGLPINEPTKNATTGKIPTSFQQFKHFLESIIAEIDALSNEIVNNNNILISVSNQKLLRSCYQIITSLGFSQCLIAGLGINLSKRCSSASMLPRLNFSDEQKYEILVLCTEFFVRTYRIPVLKNVIMTFHLSDYLAALIQLSFAPLKKPGVYKDFTMTQETYDKLQLDQKKYKEIFEYLVSNCFQPILMKELLVLQSVKEPAPPLFVKRIIAKQLSQRLLASGGLLSLIRCFIESYNIDTGLEWKKIDMICRIVAAKHGTDPDNVYLNNICLQLKQILKLNNTHYLKTAVACVLHLHEKYSQSEIVSSCLKEILQAFYYDSLMEQALPGTIILSPQEIQQKINILHACVTMNQLELPTNLMRPNLQILFMLGVKCNKNEEMKLKLKDITLKCLTRLSKKEVFLVTQQFLNGSNSQKSPLITVSEFEAGLAIKCVTEIEHPKNDTMLYFLELFKTSADNEFTKYVFEGLLLMLIDLNSRRQKNKADMLLYEDEEPVLLNELDEQYIIILQVLSEISTSPKVILVLKTDPSVVLHFIEYFLIKAHSNSDECITISLVLLNTILTNSNKSEELQERFTNLIPILQKMCEIEDDFKNILCREALSLILSGKPQKAETACSKAITNIFDSLLPIRSHGIIELTKLLEAKDPETISKKHYIFCVFQEQLKDRDSYIYLSAIKGIASLGTHCTDDVLQVLCSEFLQTAAEQHSVITNDDHNKIAETRMKIGDAIVKVTKGLGELAIVHKTVLLNTMLCACRDEDPLIRTSALSNLAEIVLCLHYKIGSIIYEVLLCVWGIIETDKAIECRRAAVMIISSLLKGLGKEMLVQLKDNLLPIYRTLKKLYRDANEDSIVRLHAQIALEELNDTMNQFFFPELDIEKQIFVIDKPEDVFK